MSKSGTFKNPFGPEFTDEWTDQSGWRTVYEGDPDSPGFGVVCDTCNLTYTSETTTYSPTCTGIRVYNVTFCEHYESPELSVRVDVLHDKHGVMTFLRDLPY